MCKCKVRCGELELQCEQLELRNQYLEAKLKEGSTARGSSDESKDAFLCVLPVFIVNLRVNNSGGRSGAQASFENVQWKMVAMDAQAKAGHVARDSPSRLLVQSIMVAG